MTTLGLNLVLESVSRVRAGRGAYPWGGRNLHGEPMLGQFSPAPDGAAGEKCPWSKFERPWSAYQQHQSLCEADVVMSMETQAVSSWPWRQCSSVLEHKVAMLDSSFHLGGASKVELY
eukprot:2125072-Rhodomonas_salina.2